MTKALAGAAAFLALIALAIGAGAGLVPIEHALAPLARILETVSPWLMGLGLMAAGLSFGLGLRRVGMGLVLLACVSGAAFLVSIRAQSVPQATGPADLRVLFFNVEIGNDAGDEIITAALASGADILVFAEARPLEGQLDRLRAAFSFVSTCGPEVCELLVASNLDVIRSWQLQLNPAWPARYSVLELDWPGDARAEETVFLAVSHLVKPWMSGLAEPELARLTAQLNWLEGPSLVVGDFNMPPWSRPMRALLAETGFRVVRGQPGSWPAEGPIRLPIDQLLLRDGVEAHAVTRFGAGLGSNHLGFVADLSIR